ncbi:hypothetical protein HMPREF9624_01911 [Oribacterium asaccharolyticum ACB7]|uniref:Uncharacterized protein n=1 Tax=Oribacterium asaccharolyticum ACB7 TaxID=796944 RepID=G9WS45_9FIRM|nr:hypothetical protein [Oribacterium asaccharolyticum]EHL14135.1 hypothetical protein HMPREF9624_01911 [Oribacterium asaccharolyticum ACB7]
MDFTQDRKSNILFGLHDSRIKKISFKNDVLTIELDTIFQYTKGEEKLYSGEVLFFDSDLEECNILIFDRTVYEGEFSGKAIGLKEYMKEYAHAEFEILTEGYFGYSTTYTGWLWEKGKEPVSAILYIWNSGDMVYRIDC